ncbi:MAG: phage anti-repressor protein [Saprospiraceae bacterium]|jgi:phage anti-repressor protein
MELQILISKKGTHVVTASNLYDALQLPLHKYNNNISKWLTDFYAFANDIRHPEMLTDYAPRNLKLKKRKDYYLSLELAKLIVLNSNSKVKQEYARYLKRAEDRRKEDGKFSKEQIVTVLELTKAMGLISCQKSVEKEHLKKYAQKTGYPHKWWEYRAQLLGYSAGELKSKMNEVGKNYKGKNLLQMLIYLDKYEIIRMAVIDLFLALGKSTSYSKNMGDLAKVFAKEMKIEIFDDRNSAINFIPKDVNPQLVEEVKTLNTTNLLKAC